MKNLPIWLRIVYFLSFYPLAVPLLYSFGALAGYGFFVWIVMLLFGLVIGLMQPAILFAISLCVIIQVYTNVKKRSLCTCQGSADTGLWTAVAMPAMLAVSVPFFINGITNILK